MTHNNSSSLDAEAQLDELEEAYTFSWDKPHYKAMGDFLATLYRLEYKSASTIYIRFPSSFVRMWCRGIKAELDQL